MAARRQALGTRAAAKRAQPAVEDLDEDDSLFPADLPATDGEEEDEDGLENDEELEDEDEEEEDDEDEDDEDDEDEEETSLHGDEEHSEDTAPPKRGREKPLSRAPSSHSDASAASASASAPISQMVVELSDPETDDDEIHVANTLGRIPLHWYDDEGHLGYDLDGKKIPKPQKKDKLDRLLDKMDNPDANRTIIDPTTGEEIVLTDEMVDMIQRLQSGNLPASAEDEEYIPFFTSIPMLHPLSSAPEPKRRFVPSKWEHERIMKIVRSIRKGWTEPKAPKKDEEEAYDLWGTPSAEESASALARRNAHIAAPKLALPGHDESYNPPAEYLLTEEEEKRWLDTDLEDRKRNFIPRKYGSLRLVPAYKRLVHEKFARCLDLYLCPRARRMKMNVAPESLLPKLPSPRDLQPFPTKQAVVYVGHQDKVTSLSVDPSGQWLATGSEDKTLRFWELMTGRCVKTVNMDAPVVAVAWCPNAAVDIVAVASGDTMTLLISGLRSKASGEAAGALLQELPPQEDRKTALLWVAVKGKERDELGIRFRLRHTREVRQLAWHYKGNYVASVCPDGAGETVCVHSLLKQQTQCPFRKGTRDVQRVLFHPSQPILFVATKTMVKVYNLQSQTLVKTLSSGCKWISSMAVHPGGDNVIVGSYDRRLCWFDLDFSTKPYRTLRYHKLALRQVCFHSSYPLFASCSDDANVNVFHGMVYNDLMQNALIVPVKILRGHTPKDGLGILDCVFHPRQPWLLTAGADRTARLFV